MKALGFHYARCDYMWNAQLCLGTNDGFGVPVEEQIKLFKEIGFDGFFTG